MGLSPDLAFYARHRHGADRRDDRGQAQAGRRHRFGPGVSAGLILGLLLVLSGPATAETLRIATYNAALVRKGPGLLLRDIRAGDAQVLAAARVIAAARPDVLLITALDYDYGQAALAAFAEQVAEAGHVMPHRFAYAPNTGVGRHIDRDRNGRTGEARDGQGFGEFSGQAGMAVLSVHPVDATVSRDLSGMLWTDLPGHLAGDDEPADQRLSTTGHWDVAVDVAGELLRLWAWYATPPVFDGPEDRNGRRNHDEVAVWSAYLDGRIGARPDDAPFVLLGDANLDPVDGDGRAGALERLLSDPRIIDPRPSSPGAARAADRGHRGDPALDTADWDDPPGNLRVDYVLPSAELTVTGAGVWWPEADADVAAASRHRLVWVDVIWP